MVIKENRKRKRYSPPYHLLLSHGYYGQFIGRVVNMSDSGVFINIDHADVLFPSLLVDVNIIGEGWDKTSPPLEMAVTRVEKAGVALKFSESIVENDCLALLESVDNIS